MGWVLRDGRQGGARALKVPKICNLNGVREHSEGDPLELWRDDESGRLVIRASNECGNNSTRVDLWDLLDWLSAGSHRGLLENLERASGEPGRIPSSGNREGH